ncbi:MAG TPA: DUF2911 domain-containing protein, partial [Gemmatimonadales bacterium]|nr:DUF2911 domain-containing protein [Gemmatimonadales bacterium]
WILAAGSLLYAAFLILKTWIGGIGASILIVVLAALPIALTAIRFSPATAVRLPCPRNWGMMPTWQLRPSPMGSVRFTVGAARVKLCYGRPALRGRRMLGGKHVPFGRLWRTGANEPTTIISTGALEIAGIQVPAGRSSLYSVPGPETWEVILNRSTSQWGIESEYSDAVKAGELGRAILPSRNLESSLERLVFFVEPGSGRSDSLDLVLRWEHSEVRIPVRSGSR